MVGASSPAPLDRLLYTELQTEPWTAYREDSENGDPMEQACILECGGSIEDPRRLYCGAILKQIFNIITVVLLLGAVFAGICTLVYDPYLKNEKPLIFYYLVATMSAEILLLAGIGLLLLLITLVFGERGRIYSNAMCGINLRILEGLSYYISSAVGLYILLSYRPHDFTKPFSHPPNSDRLIPAACYCYIVFEALLSLVYVIGACPVVLGAIGWIWHKIQMKLDGKPEVTFFKTDQPIAYWHAPNFARALDELVPREGYHRSPYMQEGTLPSVAVGSSEIRPLLTS